MVRRGNFAAARHSIFMRNLSLVQKDVLRGFLPDWEEMRQPLERWPCPQSHNAHNSRLAFPLCAQRFPVESVLKLSPIFSA